MLRHMPNGKEINNVTGHNVFLLLDHLNEQQHDKTKKMAYMPSGDSDPSGHPPSLIRVFAVCSVGS